MILTPDIIVNMSTWIIQIIAVIGILPQIFLNYKSKSTNGLSDFYIISYLSGYAVHLCYIYCLNFPIAYKIMVPVLFFLVLTLVFQRFYCFKHKVVRYSKRLYCANFLIIFLLVSLAICFPYETGNFAGWLSAIIWTVYQFPQIYKIYSKKSVKGFSFFFVSLSCLQNVLGLVVVLSLNLPAQSLFVALRGLAFFAIFCFQFWIYTDKTKKKTIKPFLKANYSTNA